MTVFESPVTSEDRNKPGEPLWKTNVDLSKVDEIGFTSLMAGAGHGTSGNTALDWIEIYGQPVPRAARVFRKICSANSANGCAM